MKSGTLVGSHMSSNFSQIIFAPPALSLKWQCENIRLRLFQAQSALSGNSQGGGVRMNIIPPSLMRSFVLKQLNQITLLSFTYPSSGSCGCRNFCLFCLQKINICLFITRSGQFVIFFFSSFLSFFKPLNCVQLIQISLTAKFRLHCIRK